ALGWLVWRHNRRVGGLLLLLAVAMGVARIYVGVHYPFDVIGGWVLGIAAAETWYRYGEPRALPVMQGVARMLARLGLA
ncbi:phosphatase PAP2 family protein, partial [Ardenticatena maritima]